MDTPSAPHSTAVSGASPVLSADLVAEAQSRISGRTRTVAVTEDVGTTSGGASVSFALEFMQHTGTFKARGALNVILTHVEAGSLPEAGITIASGGNAGVACAWAAQQAGVRATVFLPESAPAPKVERLRSYGAEVRLQGREYAEAALACEEFAAESGALMSHAYDLPLVQAGAGTLVDEILEARPDTTVIAVSVGGGGLFAGVAAAAHARGIRTLAVEPEHCCALHAAMEAGAPVDVSVESVAADSLGARRIAPDALAAAQHPLASTLLVTDEAIVDARNALWAEHRLVVEHAAATALAGVLSERATGGDSNGRAATGTAPLSGPGPHGDAGSQLLSAEDRVCVILCGANTSPHTLD